MNTIHSGLPVLAALQHRPDWYVVGFESPSRRLLIVDHKHRRSFVRVDAPGCQWGPGCRTCQERLRYALENEFRVYAAGKSEKSWAGGDLSFLAEKYYAEVEYVPVVTIESLKTIRFPFPGEIEYVRTPREDG